MNVRIVSNFVQASPTRAAIEDQSRAVTSATLYERHVKRALDLVVSASLLLLLIPAVVAIALAIRVGVGRGVLYTQKRVGRSGRTFTIVKFRTMHHDRRSAAVGVEVDRRAAHKVDHDPRHTRVGRALRRLSLDELPQLWNVLRGDMSLVGPRPEIYDVAVARGLVNHVRHSVRPGMTGPYQVSSLRLNGDLRDGLHLDEQYVQRITFLGDFRYLIRTVGLMLGLGSPGAGGS